MLPGAVEGGHYQATDVAKSPDPKYSLLDGGFWIATPLDKRNEVRILCLSEAVS